MSTDIRESNVLLCMATTITNLLSVKKTTDVADLYKIERVLQTQQHTLFWEDNRLKTA